MDELSNKIKKLRLARGLTLQEVGDIVGVGKSTVRKWENGIIENMRRDKIAKLAKALDVSPAFLMGWEDLKFSSNSSDLMSVHKKKIQKTRDVTSNSFSEDNQFEIDIAEGEEYDADYALKVKGNSMNGAAIYDGDIIFIKSMSMVNNGEIAAVQIDGFTTLKYVYWYPEKKQLVLQAANPAYPPLSYEGEALREAVILGKAVKLQRNL